MCLVVGNPVCTHEFVYKIDEPTMVISRRLGLIIFCGKNIESTDSQILYKSIKNEIDQDDKNVNIGDKFSNNIYYAIF